MFNHVFRNFDLPEEMVSNRGPQFISYVWKGLLLTYGSHGELVLRLPSADKWPDWAKDHQLGHQPPFFLWTGEPSEVPDLDYWFRAREGGTQLTSIFSVLCGGIRPSQILVTPILQHSSQGIRCGCPPENCASANRAESWVPVTLVRSPSRGRLTKSPTDYNFHPGTAFTLPSTSPTLNYSFHMPQDPPSRRHLFQKSWTSPLGHSECVVTGWPARMSHRLGWIRTWRDPGWPGMTNSIPHCWLNSTVFSWSSCTQRLWPPPSLLEGVRSRPWRRG